MSLRVGLIGTGYAARLRAEALQKDDRGYLVAVVGHTLDKTQVFSQTYSAEALQSWAELVERSDVDLVMIANVNRDHGAITRAALQAGKHTVVEYPLSLDIAEAETIIQLAEMQQKLLHVEHIELLSGIHQAIKTALPAIGTPFYVRYSSLKPERPAPQKWTYDLDLFGFPLVGAVSRVHRLINLFGKVATVSCRARFWGRMAPSNAYTACLCTAQLEFSSGLIAEVIYGKGDAIWQPSRSLDIHGEQGAILIDGEQGTLVKPDQQFPLSMGTRHGLFVKDTTMVLDHLTTGTALYVSTDASLYALRVADAIRQSAVTGQTIRLR
ncbi:MAG: Gfo/Idh/MocA family oxidoreductase [Cyanobacteria bacterium CRU_2_1]|nr:Gfo/Idh/MocA family oxidoreductase [Cyanobacteria bacterium CRU_2_1]